MKSAEIKFIIFIVDYIIPFPVIYHLSELINSLNLKIGVLKIAQLNRIKTTSVKKNVISRTHKGYFNRLLKKKMEYICI